jgi:hypothetical protein
MNPSSHRKFLAAPDSVRILAFGQAHDKLKGLVSFPLDIATLVGDTLRSGSAVALGTCGGAVENRSEDLGRSTAIAAQEISTKPGRSGQNRREAVGLPSLSGITISAHNFCSADRFSICDGGKTARTENRIVLSAKPNYRFIRKIDDGRQKPDGVTFYDGRFQLEVPKPVSGAEAASDWSVQVHTARKM